MKAFRNAGFTLIEMLLVIAIIAIILTLAVSNYSKRSYNTKIELTTIQIQQLMQAAAAYYTDNACWPVYNNDADHPSQCRNPNQPPPFTPYIPTGNPINPWGYGYKVQPTLTGNKVEISTDTPSHTIATIIVNRLPNAYTSTTTSTDVRAQEAPPGQIGGSGGIQIKLVNNIQADNTNKGNLTVPTFTCPPSWTGDLVIVSQGWQTGPYGNNGAFVPYHLQINNQCPQDNNGNFTCSINVILETLVYNGQNNSVCSLFGGSSPSICANVNMGTVNLRYFALCRPPTSSSIQTQQPVITNSNY